MILRRIANGVNSTLIEILENELGIKLTETPEPIQQ